eukprot:TRINITY_DN414_c0_g1_i1.p1 TRINITY_DN414_c0_g1~~TRINITY_DN414_c0_g1_i1.p1  ORF type:complete len:169 (+),score=17.97 TRINITY_DN414_c0_g1_i1:68-574(+)
MVLLDLVFSNFLYVGSRGAASNEELLKDHGITHILNVSGSQQRFPGKFTYMNLTLVDKPDFNISEFFNEASEFIETARKQGKKILVHCTGGVSRSPTIALAYLVISRNLSLKDALMEIGSRKPNLNPNRGFCAQLLDLEFRVRGRNSVKLVEVNKKPKDALCRYLIPV